MRHRRQRRRRPASTTLVLAVAMATAVAACGGPGGAAEGEGDARTTAWPGQSGASTHPSTTSVVPSPGGDAAAVRDELRALEASHRGRIGAYAIDTATGATVSYRANEPFPAMSTFKAVLAGAILREARTTDPGLMRRVIRWKRADLVAHSPITGRAVNLKNGLTVAELCEAAVAHSDNTAANLLLARIGGPAGMTRFYRAIGDPVSRLDHREPDLDQDPRDPHDTTTPYHMATDLRTLTLGDALAPPDEKALIGWLRANTTGDERIKAGLPRGWVVGDKTGTSGAYGVANDVAVAWPPSRAPVVIAVFSNRTAAGGKADDRVVATTASIVIRALGLAT